MNPLVSVEWLREHLNDSDLIILDASTPDDKSGEKCDFQNIGIKGARFFDLKRFSDPGSVFPNTMPTPKQFEVECQKLGINSSSMIVVYDNLGVYTSPRVRWMFKVMGHKQIAVLDGGLPKWIEKGYETQQLTAIEYAHGDFKAHFKPDLIRYINNIDENIQTENMLVIDARSEGRFKGTAPEPRKGLDSGHIPKSTNLPYTRVLEDGKYKSPEHLKTLFNNIGTGNKPLIFSCGSGITACIIMLAAELVIANEKSVYDGSWTEWALSNKPIEKS